MDDEKVDGQQDSELVDKGTYPQAVELWPLIPVAFIAALLIAAWLFLPDAKHRAENIPLGKKYAAVGAMISCMQISSGSSRVMVRTPNDTFFDVFFRQAHEPPNAGMAVGNLSYHECGKVDGQTVHCFDSFQPTHEGLPPLDANGKRIVQK